MVALMLLLAGRLGADENRGIKIVEVRKIWDAARTIRLPTLNGSREGGIAPFGRIAAMRVVVITGRFA